MSASAAISERPSRLGNMLRTALGAEIATWLNEPQIVEIMLNPDGRLWLDRLDIGLVETSSLLSAADGERIIRLVAHHVGAEAHPGSPRVSAELPESGERFEGLLPPLAAAPCFAIRKPAVSSGIKVLVLAVIVGIGTNLFAEFTAGFGGEQPTLEDAAVIILASLSLLGLGIFGPGIANGLISGGPQLGAGAAIGTGLAVAGAGMAGAGAARMAGGAVMGGAKSAAAMSGAASGGYSGAKAASGGSKGAGIAGGAKAAASQAMSPLRKATGSLRDSFQQGKQGAVSGSDSVSENTSDQPGWAKKMNRSQSVKSGASIAAHSIRSGDGAGSSTQISLKEE